MKRVIAPAAREGRYSLHIMPRRIAMTDVINIATKLAGEFRPRAAELDRSAKFPFENYDRMRDEGYLRALVPLDLGGMGVGLAEMARAQQALARGCASTALAVNMHHFQVGVMADNWRKGVTAPEAILRRIVADGAVLGSTGAEAIVAGDWICATTAEQQDGHYVINGRKFFCSQAPGMDFVRVNARDTETGELLVFSLPAQAEGVKVVETWDTTGMRATASHDLVLENVRVPDTAVGARLPGTAPMRLPPIMAVARWFLPLMSSVYLGIAEEAREEAYKSLGSGINSNSRDDVLTNVLVGEMEAAFLTASSVRDAAAEQLNEPPADLEQGVARAVLAKEVVVEKANETVEKAVQIAGGRSYFRKSPLERLARDVRAGRFHPPASPVSMQMAGERLREQRARAAAAVS
jgi:alkylation response protein AidB-like acyl-CoA dehydrogenase